MQASDLLPIQENLYQKILENIGDLVSVVDLKTNYLYASPSHFPILGYRPEDLIGQRALSFFHPKDAPTLRRKLQECLRRQQRVSTIARMRHRSGHWVFLEGVGTPITNSLGQSEMVLVASRDVSERIAMENRIRHLAMSDPLTELPNRLLYADRAERAFKVSRRSGRKVAVLMLDLDHFKEVNDTFGHVAGDVLLKSVAGRLSDGLREADTVSRFGGDEFSILLPELNQASDALTVMEKICDEFRRPFALEKMELAITISIGGAVFPDHGPSLDSILKAADDALYRAKGRGKNCYEMAPPL